MPGWREVELARAWMTSKRGSGWAHPHVSQVTDRYGVADRYGVIDLGPETQ